MEFSCKQTKVNFTKIKKHPLQSLPSCQGIVPSSCLTISWRSVKQCQTSQGICCESFQPHCEKMHPLHLNKLLIKNYAEQRCNQDGTFIFTRCIGCRIIIWCLLLTPTCHVKWLLYWNTEAHHQPPHAVNSHTRPLPAQICMAPRDDCELWLDASLYCL